MNQFDVGKAIFWGFKSPTNRNFIIRLLLWTTVLFLIVYAIFGRGFIAGYAELLQSTYDVEQSNDPEAAMALFGVMGRWFSSMILMMLAGWAIFASAETAYHKNALHGIDHGFIPLRFGVQELSVMLVQLVVYICVMGAYMAGGLALILVVLLGAAFSGISEILGAILAGLLGIVGFVVWIAALFLVSVRLAPAAAMTVRDGEIRIFQAWSLTKPYFWPMLGSFLIVFLVGYVLIYVVMILFIMLAFGDTAAIEIFSGVSNENPEEVFGAMKELMKTPRVILFLVTGMISYFTVMWLWYLGLWGVSNMAVQVDGATEEA